MEVTDTWTQVEKTAIASKNTFFIAFLFTFALKFIQISLLATSLDGNMDQMISVVHVLQLVFHLPLMNIMMQANVMSYLDIVIPVVMFDFIDSVSEISDAFEGLFPGDEQKDIRD